MNYYSNFCPRTIWYFFIIFARRNDEAQKGGQHEKDDKKEGNPSILGKSIRHKSFMTKSRKGIIIIFIYFAILMLGIVICLLKFSKANIYGTYTTNSGVATLDTKYIVFQYDGKFTMYRQFHVDEEGTYTTTTEDHVILVNMRSESGTNHCAIYDYKDSIFVFGIQESDITKYKRISKDAVFTNIINDTT